MERAGKIIINYIAKTMAIMVIFGILLPSVSVRAEEAAEEGDTEIIIVLDASQSMKKVDSSYAALDFIRGVIAVVPRNYEIGIVVYNNEICLKLPAGSSYDEIQKELENIEYRNYGDAGAGLSEAISLFENQQAEKRILMISDGEIMLKTEEETEKSVQAFAQAVEQAKKDGIPIDIVALGQRIEEGNTIYSAAESTSGSLYELPESNEFSNLMEQYLFHDLKIKERNIGTLNGTSGELSIMLPDRLMDKAKIILLGKQNNENLTVNCKADNIQLFQGENYTVVEINKPESEEIRIQMTAENMMEIDAYLSAEYSFSLSAEHDYVPETETAEIWLSIMNPEGKNLLEGHMNDSRLKLYLNGEERKYTVSDGKIYIEENITQDEVLDLKLKADELYGNYYGNVQIRESVEVPPPEPEKEVEWTDWLFWAVMFFFIAALLLLFFLSKRNKKKPSARQKIIDESRIYSEDTGTHRNDFFGKILVYVIYSKDDIDYPPESINLFARCSREMITLEWILDTCNLPLHLKGAEKIVIKPGDDRSLIIKNSGSAAAMKGRELLIKGRSYHMYYHEKVTFIFDQEDTEIEVHYKDLKPNER